MIIVSKHQAFLTAIHRALALSVVGEAHQYMMKVVLRARRHERNPNGNPSDEEIIQTFLDMHAPKADRDAYRQMFLGALQDWSPDYKLSLDIEYRNEEEAMLEPLIKGIVVRN